LVSFLFYDPTGISVRKIVGEAKVNNHCSSR